MGCLPELPMKSSVVFHRFRFSRFLFETGSRKFNDAFRFRMRICDDRFCDGLFDRVRRSSLYRFGHGGYVPSHDESDQSAAEFSFPAHKLDIRRFAHDVESVDRRGYAGYFDESE